MPVKAADVTLTDKDFAVISATLCNMESFQVDWQVVNKALQVKNSGRDFRATLKKFELKLEAGAISPIDEDDATNTKAAAAPTTTKAKSGNAKGKGKASEKKGKASEKKRNAKEASLSEDDDNEDGKKVKVQDEDDD